MRYKVKIKKFYNLINRTFEYRAQKLQAETKPNSRAADPKVTAWNQLLQCLWLCGYLRCRNIILLKMPLSEVQNLHKFTKNSEKFYRNETSLTSCESRSIHWKINLRNYLPSLINLPIVIFLSFKIYDLGIFSKLWQEGASGRKNVK